MSKASFFSSLSKALSLLNRKNFTYSVYSFICSISIGALELLGLLMIIAMIYIFSEYHEIASNERLSFIFNFFPNANPHKIANIIIVAIVVLFLVKNILVILLTYFQNLFLNRIAVQITESVYVKTLNKKYTYFLNTDSNHIVRDVYVIPYDYATAMLQSYSVIFNETFVLLFILISLLFVNFKIIIFLALTVLPVAYLTMKFTREKLKSIGQEKNKVQPLTYKSFYESIHGYIDVVMYDKKNYFIVKIIGYLKHFYRQILLVKVMQLIPVKAIEFIAISSLALMFFYTVYFLDGNFISLLVLFSTAAYKVLPSTNKIISANMIINNTSYIFDHLTPQNEVENSTNNTLPQHNDIESINFNEKITLTDLSFGYFDNDSEKALHNINLEIPIGVKIGFIGESGSGKTTLSKVILGLLMPTSGEINVDGVPINNKNIETYRKNISYVRQDYFMLDGTIAENIAFGEVESEIDYERVDAIIKEVKLLDLVNSNTLGVRTKIGEFGAKISGGQKQRIAIARALYYNAKVIVLDEATSALDDKTEEEVMNTIYNVDFKNITLIMIAHRISSLKNCDWIYEMHKGKIVNKYTYKQLVSKRTDD